jgi:hypothetical protein
MAEGEKGATRRIKNESERAEIARERSRNEGKFKIK